MYNVGIYRIYLFKLSTGRKASFRWAFSDLFVKQCKQKFYFDQQCIYTCYIVFIQQCQKVQVNCHGSLWLCNGLCIMCSMFLVVICFLANFKENLFENVLLWNHLTNFNQLDGIASCKFIFLIYMYLGSQFYIWTNMYEVPM